MSLVKKLMGRRQFLIATGVASTCALTCRKLAGFEARAAAAAGKTAAAASKTTGNRCPNLLAPLKIRNRVLKNRIYHTVAPTYFMQGPENYPTELYRNHYSNMAKNAAIVSVSTHFESEKASPSKLVASEIVVDNAFNHYSDCSWADIPLTVNYINEMIDDMHYQGTLILFAGNTGMGGMGGGGGAPGGGGEGQEGEGGAGGPGGMPEGGMGGMPQGGAPGGGMPGGAPSGGMPGGTSGESGRQGGAPGGGGFPGFAAQTDEEIVADAQAYEKKGYDVYEMRTASAEAAKEIKATTNLILMGSVRGGGGGMPGQTTEAPTAQATKEEIEEGVEQARALEGIADIIWIRIDKHPNSWYQDKGRPKSLAYAEAIKKAKIDIITCPSAGFHNPVENDAFIAEGRTDMVGMTTPLFADPELVRKISEGRPEDVLPCLGCQDCHGISMNNPPWYSTCTVNPTWGLPPYQLQGITEPRTSKKVAVIGGGPAGMKAAIIAAERGHKVTLYERDKALGGLMKIADNSECRYDHKNLKEFYIRQVEKNGIEVKLGNEATPEMIKKEKYDTVLVATGAEVITSKVKASGTKVFNILEAYAKKDELGKEVVIIGAGKFGVEAGVGMLKDGRKVTVLALGDRLVEEKLRGAHNMMAQEDIYNTSPDFSYALGCTIKDISGGKVTYTDNRGNEKSVKADSVVMWKGLKPRVDEAEKFFGSADQVLLVGDCTGRGGTLQRTFRSAFFTASQV